MSKRTKYISQADREARSDRAWVVIMTAMICCLILLPSMSSAVWRIAKMLLMAAGMIATMYYATSLYCMTSEKIKREERHKDE